MAWHPASECGKMAESRGEFKTLRKLPDPILCQARKIGEGLVECLVEKPENCPHALAYGCGFFCRHPKRLEIAEQTKE